MKSKAGHKSLGNELRKHADVVDGTREPVHLTSAFSLGHLSHLSSEAGVG